MSPLVRLVVFAVLAILVPAKGSPQRERQSEGTAT